MNLAREMTIGWRRTPQNLPPSRQVMHHFMIGACFASCVMRTLRTHH
jgi:hypothetical protein